MGHSNNKRLYNIFIINENDVEVKFSNRKESFFVDLDDYEKIKNIPWYYSKSVWGDYIVGYIRSKNKNVRLNRFIMGVTKKGEYVDHIDRNTMNNRKSNLRICTNQQNSYNQKVAKNNKSGYVGIYWEERLHKWIARIKYNYKNRHIGCYETLDDAVVARLKAEIEYCGREFAPQRYLFKQYGL